MPAAVRFLSCEPLLGPLDDLRLDGIGWVIAGSESGPGHRPLDVAWVSGIRDECLDAEVPFFFKLLCTKVSLLGLHYDIPIGLACRPVVLYVGEEGGPSFRFEAQDGTVCHLAVTDAELVARELRGLNAVPVAHADRTLDPVALASLGHLAKPRSTESMQRTLLASESVHGQSNL